MLQWSTTLNEPKNWLIIVWLTTMSVDGKQEQMESACYYAVTEHDVSFFFVVLVFHFKWRIKAASPNNKLNPHRPIISLHFP